MMALGLLRVMVITITAMRAKEDVETSGGQWRFQAFTEVINLLKEVIAAVEEDTE